MASVSIGRAWEETSAFVKREGGLLFPVALLLISIPFALLFQMIPLPVRQAIMARGEGAANVPVMIPASLVLGAVMAGAIAVIGTLTLYALALRPGISVAEALQLALRRFAVLTGASALIFAGLLVPVIAVSALPPPLGQLGLLAVLLFLSVRFMASNAVIVDRGLGVFATIRECWQLTRGHFWRLSAYLLIGAALTTLAQVVAQMLFGLVGYAIGGASAGQAAADTGLSLVFGVAQVYFAVMISRIYQQLSA
ncbi:MAG: hypothetical protein ABI395_06985 [Sphingobium sp.]